MLKKILGQAPFDVVLCGDVFISPDRKSTVQLLFSNDTEYDLPLCCTLRLCSSVNTDKISFDVILPAMGNTRETICFSQRPDEKIFGGTKICELEILDSIFDSKTEYEFDVNCEMSYKCLEEKNVLFSASDEGLFTREGRFFANRGETVSLEIPSMSETEIELSVISGEILDFSDGQRIKLDTGLNRLSFTMSDDGCFEFKNPVSGDGIFIETLNPKHFI